MRNRSGLNIGILPSSIALPPRLSVGDYTEFVRAAMHELTPMFAARKKSIKNRTGEPLRISGKASGVAPDTPRPRSQAVV